jgi:hypothetical protein
MVLTRHWPIHSSPSHFLASAVDDIPAFGAQWGVWPAFLPGLERLQVRLCRLALVDASRYVPCKQEAAQQRIQ